MDHRFTITPFQSLSNSHSGKVVALKAISSRRNTLTRDYDILLSASEDGTFAFWDMDTWNLLSFHNVQTIYNNDDPELSINCADVFENIIALGLSNRIQVV